MEAFSQGAGRVVITTNVFSMDYPLPAGKGRCLNPGTTREHSRAMGCNCRRQALYYHETVPRAGEESLSNAEGTRSPLDADPLDDPKSISTGIDGYPRRDRGILPQGGLYRGSPGPFRGLPWHESLGRRIPPVRFSSPAAPRLHPYSGRLSGSARNMRISWG